MCEKFMNRPDTTFLEEQIRIITAWRQEFQWVVDFGLQAAEVANFGCYPYGKSLAIMWALGAHTLTGIDPDEKHTYQEEVNLSRMQLELRSYWNFLTKSEHVTEEDIQWWNQEVPAFFKHELSQNEFQIDYLPRDVTRYTGLPANFFDVAFCDFFLHEIWWDKARGNSEYATLFAIGQMAHVVRPEGYLAAYEWVQTGTFHRLDFRRLFEQAGLTVVHMREERLDNWRGKGYAARFICQKR